MMMRWGNAEDLPPWARDLAAIVRNRPDEIELVLLVGPDTETGRRTALVMVSDLAGPEEIDELAVIGVESMMRLVGIPDALAAQS